MGSNVGPAQPPRGKCPVGKRARSRYLAGTKPRTLAGPPGETYGSPTMTNTPRKGLLGAAATLLALTLTACTTTYTQADVEAEEQRLDARAKVEERVDEEIGATGGTADAITRERLGEAGEWMAEEEGY